MDTTNEIQKHQNYLAMLLSDEDNGIICNSVEMEGLYEQEDGCDSDGEYPEINIDLTFTVNEEVDVSFMLRFQDHTTYESRFFCYIDTDNNTLEDRKNTWFFDGSDENVSDLLSRAREIFEDSRELEAVSQCVKRIVAHIEHLHFS